ncbi:MULTISPECIES: glycosyltransferase family 1 protein [Clostridium]|uniref:Glycosyltransferase family 4 protein n=1 Tax=Clostridium cibarium TaxID=2762247 RepID=A0ABR8PWU2_9CLOT|nr:MULTISPECIES: glycosyltransferase family 1 protein [Clostridium]MBD7912614.1 glycosyltransferase family 4 protein [Clostridium cibarium]
MKLGIDSRSINLHSGSGIGTYTKNLVLNLLDIDKEDNFNLIWTGNELEEYNKSNVTITHLSGRYSGFYEACYIPHLLQNKGIDLYHIPQNGIGFPFDCNLNVVVTIHDLIPFIMPETVGIGYLTKFLKDMPNIIESSKGILTVSEYSKKDILRFFPSFPEEKIFVTPLATNHIFKPISKNYCKKYLKENYNIEDPYIFYVGGFSKRKNVKELITSFSAIKNELKVHHKLVIAGSLRDEGELLKSTVHSLGLQDKIIFTGYLPDELLPIFYSGAEAFVYPSLYEGFGLPPLEAMSCKTPVITSNLTSIPEVTSDSAILINPSNSDELQYNLIKLLNDESLKEELKEKGHKKSLEFSWIKTAEKTLQAYKSLI